MVKHAFLVLGVLGATAASAAAQDFGTDWIDRVSNELTAERGPLSVKPWELHATGGVAYYFDDNVYLMEDDEVDDSIIIPFIQATLTYSEPRFEFMMDALLNYKWYADDDSDDSTPLVLDSTEGASDDEERFFLRARQAAARYSIELAQILQRVSDPIGVTFTERAERFVSNTIPRASFDLSRQWAVEGVVNYQVVRYDDGDLGQVLENNAARADAALVYRTAHGYDLLAQAGWQDIAYIGDESLGAPPDAWGWYARLGFRGNLIERLYLEAYAGYDHIESDYFIGTSVDQEDNTMGANVALRYELSQTVTFSAEYARQFTFAGGTDPSTGFGDPYQRVDRVLGIFTAELTPEVGLKLRGQYDHAMTALSTERNYFSGGGSAWWKPIAWMIVDAGVTIRSGDVESQDATIDSEYDGTIFHVGVAATY